MREIGRRDGVRDGVREGGISAHRLQGLVCLGLPVWVTAPSFDLRQAHHMKPPKTNSRKPLKH